MKYLGTILVAIAVAGAVVGQETYDAKYDDFDVHEVLGNERLLKNYVYCLLDKGPCTPEGKTLKEHIPEVLSSHCEKCTTAQKTIGKKVVLEMMKNHPDYWKELSAKYDPEGKYHDSYKKDLKPEA